MENQGLYKTQITTKERDKGQALTQEDEAILLRFAHSEAREIFFGVWVADMAETAKLANIY